MSETAKVKRSTFLDVSGSRSSQAVCDPTNGEVVAKRSFAVKAVQLRAKGQSGDHFPGTEDIGTKDG